MKERLTVIPTGGELEWHSEREVLLLRRPQIDFLQAIWIGDHRFDVHNIHKRLLQGNLTDAAVVEAVHVLPD